MSPIPVRDFYVYIYTYYDILITVYVNTDKRGPARGAVTHRLSIVECILLIDSTVRLTDEYCTSELDDDATNRDIYTILARLDEELGFNKETIFAYDEADLNLYNTFNINEVPNSNLQECSELVKTLINIDKYDENTRGRIESLCEKYADTFKLSNEKLNATHMAEHKIITTDS